MSIRKLKARGIGRLELLAWLNELLQTDYTKIEHLADGIAYCQIVDALHPGKVGLQLVNFNARSIADCERNFRVLRKAFHACDIRKEIPVRKLLDGVFQEHFEFLHWMHDYAHKTYPDAVRKYNGLARREQVLGPRHSLTETSGANMNLVPSYTTSSRFQDDGGFPNTLANAGGREMIDPEESDAFRLCLADLIGEETSDAEVPGGAGVQQRGVDPDDVVVEPKDPWFRLVKESHRSTMQAQQLLDQLHKTMALVLDDPNDKATVKKDAAKASARAVGKPKGGEASSRSTGMTAAKKKTSLKTAPADPPFLAPQLNQVIDVLAAELTGRALDMRALEDEVAQLALTLQKPVADAASASNATTEPRATASDSMHA